MNDLGGLLQTGLAIFGLASLAGVGLQRGTITSLRSQLDDERKETTSLRTRLDERDTDNTRLLADNKALQRLATATPDWQAIRRRLDEHHTESMAALANVLAALKRGDHR